MSTETEPTPVVARPDRVIVNNLGTVKSGDLIVVRYETGIPDDLTRRKDYVALRDFFQRQALHVRFIAIEGGKDLWSVTEEEMARFGWVRKR